LPTGATIRVGQRTWAASLRNDTLEITSSHYTARVGFVPIGKTCLYSALRSSRP
jgi:hypothetical protein